MIRLFLDTEFTDFIHAGLISIGLCAEDGRAFYAESTDYNRSDCSQFTEYVVLPLLDASNPLQKAETHQGSERKIGFALQQWVRGLGDEVEVITDCAMYDWEFMDWLLTLGGGRPENLIGCHETHVKPVFGRESRQHHALDDAIALRNGYMIEISSGRVR